MPGETEFWDKGGFPGGGSSRRTVYLFIGADTGEATQRPETCSRPVGRGTVTDPQWCPGQRFALKITSVLWYSNVHGRPAITKTTRTGAIHRRRIAEFHPIRIGDHPDHHRYRVV
jgi:hypothetical protein